jgi:hypothetical protein
MLLTLDQAGALPDSLSPMGADGGAVMGATMPHSAAG